MRFTEHRKEKRIHGKQIVVFYHADCTDGFTSAWVAWKKFGNRAEYLPYFHDDEPPKMKNKEVYMLDMTFPEKVTRRLMKDNKTVTAIDHHVSVKSVTLMTYKSLYALSHSGCVLAWKYFFPKKPVPEFLLYIEDVDIWRQKMKGSHFLYCYLDLFDFKFDIWSGLVRDFEISEKKKRMIVTGDLFYRRDSRIVDHSINKNARLVELDGHKVYAINSNNSTNNFGEKLRTTRPPFAIIWHQKKDGGVVVSLRGVGNVDCSKIAKKYGGGGHKHSAAFRLKSLKNIPWK